MQVGEICTRDVLCASSETSVAAAARLMRQYHAGDVVVVQQAAGRRIPIGIVTDRDIVVSVTATGVSPADITVAEIMGSGLVTAIESEGVFESIDRMRSHGVRRMPIVDGEGGLTGIVSIDDILEILAEQMSGIARLIAREQVQEEHARP